MAEAYSTTPYKLVTDPLAEYSFNHAIFVYGSRVDRLLEETIEIESFGKKEIRRKHDLEEALHLASEDPRKPKLEGLSSIFQSLR